MSDQYDFYAQFPVMIKLDRDYYGKIPVIYRWLTEHYGSMMDDNPKWYAYDMFGYQHIYFKHNADLVVFETWVKTI